VYSLHGKPEQFENLLYPGVGHVYVPEMWEKTVSWLNKWVKRQS
jgi:hypothetical protein